jgi:hypothetical protein
VTLLERIEALGRDVEGEAGLAVLEAEKQRIASVAKQINLLALEPGVQVQAIEGQNRDIFADGEKARFRERLRPAEPFGVFPLQRSAVERQGREAEFGGRRNRRSGEEIHQAISRKPKGCSAAAIRSPVTAAICGG